MTRGLIQINSRAIQMGYASKNIQGTSQNKNNPPMQSENSTVTQYESTALKICPSYNYIQIIIFFF
jgi:hypothetical protein